MHVHTTASDGVYTPEEAMLFAKELGLAAIGITDHDTTESLDPARKASMSSGIELIEGIEISTQYEGEDTHILGYCLRFDAPEFIAFLEEMKAKRQERMRNMVIKLKDHGIKIDLDLLKSITKDATPGRPHLARTLVQMGHARTPKEAFHLYLLPGRPGYYPRAKVSPEAAIKLILSVGGVPVLAHPGLSGGINVEWMVKEFIACGLKGIEIYHPAHSKPMANHYENMCNRYGLLPTGGSDAHGYEHGGDIGSVRVPYLFVEQLKKSAIR